MVACRPIWPRSIVHPATQADMEHLVVKELLQETFPGKATNGVRQGGVPQGGVPQGVVPQGQRAANGTPMPMAGAQRFATGAPGAPGPGGPRGPTPGGMAPPGMRPGAPMPRSPSGQMPRTAGTPGVNPIIVEG
ncbi:MAG: hypothetical protein STHCBS139747_000402 [Sporothrix thermara]